MEEMKTKKTGKIVALIIAIVVVALGVSVGVMAATGVFSSGKSKAFDLLAQAPEKLSYSSMDEYIGTKEITKEMLEKGGQVGFKISDLTLDSSIAPSDLDLNGFSAEVSAKSNKSENQNRMSVSLEKGGSKLSLDMYADKEKAVLSLPELVSGKVFKLDYEAIKKAAGSVYQTATASPEMEKFSEDLQEFFEDEIKKVKDDITCEKLSGDKEGYKLVIKKESMDTVMNDFVEFLNEQDSIVTSINTYVQALMIRNGEMQTFDLISEVKKIVAQVSQYTQDFAFEVYGKDGELTGIATTYMVEMIPIKASVDFEGEKGNQTVTMKVMAEQNGQEAGLTMIIKDTKADIYEHNLSLDVSAGGYSAASLTIAESFNPSDNSYAFDESAKADGSEFLKLTAKGAIKDLKQGSYADCVLDDVSVSVNGVEYVKMALDCKIGVIDGSIEPPQGEEVAVTNGTEILPYLTEVQTALAKVMSDWGINPSSLTDSYNPLGSSTVPQWDTEEGLIGDRSSLDDIS